MNFKAWLDVATVVVGFLAGATLVWRVQRMRAAGRVRPLHQAPVAPVAAPHPRPQQQIPVQRFEAIVQSTSTRELLAAVERRTRFSAATFARDCLPVLEVLAEFVQMLPASESHHHAQPGGLWTHALEVLDAALTFRAGMELPSGASTEDRKKQEHRWTFAVFAAALLHDVGKPVTDVKVLLFGDDPRSGRPWAPMAGSMKTFGAGWYSVGFGDPGERDYKAHAKLPAMLLHSFVEPRVMRWMAEEGDVLAQLLAYLSGDDPDGTLGSIIKRADSDSVRRNLLQGPRTRFSSARTRPLIERLMEALRRMLHEGAALPLNRPGAAGWVHDGKVWFVCARLADEVRNYLAQHESAAGVPGKDRNDRLFDTWQESGAIAPAPDGGAIWRVRVECDGWSPPDVFTVLAFPLEKLYDDAAAKPTPMRGRVWVPGTGASTAGAAPASPASASAAVVPSAPAPLAQLPVPVPPSTAPAMPSAAAAAAAVAPLAAAGAAEKARQADPVAEPPAVAAPAAHGSDVEMPRDTAQTAPEAERSEAAPAQDDGLLSPQDAAGFQDKPTKATTTPELGAPLRPKERGVRTPASPVAAQNSIKLRKAPSPAATAFMAWVANGVGSGAIKYNEDSAPVHFVAAGALLLTPELFKRFLSEHEAVPDGPIAALRESHGDKAYARLQNELAKSGWSVRNGDTNVHAYAFVKADKQLSRPASFFLIGQPALFWNPVPAPNERIRRLDAVQPALASPARPGGIKRPAGAAGTAA